MVFERKFGRKVLRVLKKSGTFGGGGNNLRILEEKEKRRIKDKKIQDAKFKERKKQRQAIEQSREVTDKTTTFLVSGRRFTEGELTQAQSLIFKGRQFAAKSDARLTDLIRRLERGGQRSAVEIQQQRKTIQRNKDLIRQQQEKEQSSAEAKRDVRTKTVKLDKKQGSVRNEFVKVPRNDFNITAKQVTVSQKTPDIPRDAFLEQRPKSNVRAVQQPDKIIDKPENVLENLAFKLQKKRDQIFLDTARDRSKGRTETDLEKVAISALVGFGTTLVNAGLFFKNIPSTTVSFIKDPVGKSKQTVKNIPVALKDFSRTLQNEPSFATGSILGEIILFKGSGKVISVTGKGGSVLKTRLSPKFVKTKKVKG